MIPLSAPSLVLLCQMTWLVTTTLRNQSLEQLYKSLSIGFLYLLTSTAICILVLQFISCFLIEFNLGLSETYPSDTVSP